MGTSFGKDRGPALLRSSGKGARYTSKISSGNLSSSTSIAAAGSISGGSSVHCFHRAKVSGSGISPVTKMVFIARMPPTRSAMSSGRVSPVNRSDARAAARTSFRLGKGISSPRPPARSNAGNRPATHQSAQTPRTEVAATEGPGRLPLGTLPRARFGEDGRCDPR